MMWHFCDLGLAQTETSLMAAISTRTDSGIADREGLKQCFYSILNSCYLCLDAFSLYLMIIPPNIFIFRYFNNKNDDFAVINDDFDGSKMEILKGPDRAFLRS